MAESPTLPAFFEDMNKHGNAEYKRVGRYVLEAERGLRDAAVLTVWGAVESVEDGEAWAEPTVEGNGFAWDGEGRAQFDTWDEATDRMAEIDTEAEVEKFTEAHPYDGPKTPYHEREDTPDVEA